MGFFSGLMSYLGGRERNASQERINQDNIRLSWDMWNASNAYNHPVNQMARFKAAGLNPNLIYGQMSNVPPPAMVKSEVGDGTNGFDAIADAIKDYETMQIQRDMNEHQMKVADANVEIAKDRNDIQREALKDSADRMEREFKDRAKFDDLQKQKIKEETALLRAKRDEIEHPKASPIANLISGIAKKLGIELEPETAEGVVEGVGKGVKFAREMRQERKNLKNYRNNVRMGRSAYHTAGID